MEILSDPVLLEVLIDDYRKDLFERLAHKLPLDIPNSSELDIIEYQSPLGERLLYVREFRLNGYSLVPIFLNVDKNLKNICILKLVNNNTGINYYYMIIKRDYNEDICSIPPIDNFQIEESLFDSEKILILDDSNYCLKNFLDMDGDAQFNSHFICFETLKIFRLDWKEKSGIFDLPRHDLCLAASKPVDEFLKSYLLSSELLNIYTSWGYLIVRKDSFSYKRLKEFLKPQGVESDTLRHIEGVFETAFRDSEYLKKEKIIPNILRHINSIYNITSHSNPIFAYFTSVLVVLQSSGYGKSRTFVELGSTLPVFYSSLQASYSGYPPKSFYLNRLIEKFDSLFLNPRKSCHANTACAVLYAFILRVIYLIFKFPYDNQKAIFIDQAIDNILGNHRENNFTSLFNGLDTFCTDTTGSYKVEFSYDSTARAIPLPNWLKVFKLKFFREGVEQNLDTNNLENDVVSLFKEKRKEGYPCLFVVDEAHSLLNPKVEEGKKYWRFTDIHPDTKSEYDALKLPYQIFRRTFRIFSVLWKYLWLIIISTNGKIGNFITDARNEASRKNEAVPFLFRPFILAHTYSCKSKLPNKPTVEELNNLDPKFPHFMTTKIDENYLESNERVIDLFNRGRPLVRDTFELTLLESSAGLPPFQEYMSMSIFGSLELQFLFEKLSNTKVIPWNEEDFRNLDFSIACRYSILGFSIGLTCFPPTIGIEELIEKNLMTLLHVDSNNLNQIAGFFPEGPLNSVASWYLCKYFSKFFNYLASLSSQGLCDIGLYGEFIARIILLCCHFYSIDSSLTFVRQLIFSPLPLKRFLEVLSKNKRKVDEYFINSPLLEGSILNFSYFQPLICSGSFNPYEAMLQCFINGSAAFLKYNFPGVDFLIPLILADGRMSFLGVQVKLDRNLGPSRNSFVSCYEKMRFSHIFGVHPSLQNDRPFALLIMSLCQSTFTFDSVKKNRNNDVFVINEQDVISWRNIRKKPKIIFEEGELPPALVICGCSYRFGDDKQADHKGDNISNVKPDMIDYQTFFEKLIYDFSPRLNTIHGLGPKKFLELEALNDSISAKLLPEI
jgi:hypothetical protein